MRRCRTAFVQERGFWLASADYSFLVRPKRSLIRTGVISFFLASLPVFAVLYWYTAAHDVWCDILGAQIVLFLACLALWWRQTTVFSAVTPTEMVGRGIFSPLVHVPLASVASVSLVPVFGSNADDTTTQLVALNADGVCLWRMRGQYWHDGDLQAFADAVGRPVTVESAPLNQREFFEFYPGAEYWFENSLPVRVALITGSTLVVLLIVAGVMRVMGIPLVGG